ncbi:uncharacterized protein LTR77_008299 [Saxophila tyrrhenica]|uniref:DUF803-domain-containing protein n=1 Tax=Saxophila tyrrhenica TaxID=1690608 RepID=A0AAV9P4G0_9PEZI|nr:hypothetical protein LTR77_008299 [Saxophila tyrrhenica]
MYIPPGHPLPNSSYNVYKHSDGSTNSAPDSQKWSSLIGIITAICGNILISFALNTQRYAHIRLSREQEEREEKARSGRKRRRAAGYGTQGEQQVEVAEQRAQDNAKAEREQYPLEEADETAPLIPTAGSIRSASTGDEDNEEEDGHAKEKSYLRSPIWWLGIAMMTLGEAGNFLAYGFAPASIVSPLGVVALVSNCLIAPLLLHERFRWRDALGVVVAVGGCVTVVLSASDSNPKLDPDSIWHLITRWEFETYLGITVVMIVCLMAASNKFGERTILIDLGLVGLFGGYTALSTKGVASLLSSSIWRVIEFPITYLLVAVLVSTAVLQIKYVNRALQRFNATMVIPTQFVMFTLSVIIGSAVLYRDFERTTGEQAGKFVGGCALTFLGVYFITSGRGEDDEEEEHELAEGEDGIDLPDEEQTQVEVRERDDGRRQSLLAGSPKSAPASRGLQVSESVPDLLSANLSPAKAAAVHEQSVANIPSPQRQTQKQTLPPPMHATTSAPEVPTITPRTPASRPKTPGRGATHHPIMESPSQPSTPQPRRPPPDQAGQLDPGSSNRLLNRHSIAGLVPGPLTSPLSSSLTAIVADSLRRGVDGGSALRRRSLYRGSSRRDPNAPPLKRHSIASGEMDFSTVNEETTGGGAGASGAGQKGRMRSLSAALGDVFGPSTGGKGGSMGARDPER